MILLTRLPTLMSKQSAAVCNVAKILRRKKPPQYFVPLIGNIIKI